MSSPGYPLRIRAEDGFTMIIAIGVMLVTSLLLVAAFTVAEGEIQLSRNDTTQKQAYYAALSGIQQYEYHLQAEPDFWETCEGLESNVPAKEKSQEVERYVVTPVSAASAPEGAKCSTADPAAAMIQTKGPFQNTFRVKSVGEVTVNGKRTETRTLIATFGVTNFLDYVYYTNFETVDPGLYKFTTAEPSSKNCNNKFCSNETLAKDCEGLYYEQWSSSAANPSCPAILFKPEDQIEGPMHTNDTADVTGGTFGRKTHEPKDKIEMYGGTYGTAAGCKNGATYYTASGCYTTKEQLVEKLDPPPDDTSLAAYVEPNYEFEGRTVIELKGTEMLVHYHDSEGIEHSETMGLPPNGLIYVEDNTHGHACPYKFEVENSDTSTEESEEKFCGNVYVKGNYSQSLTVAGSRDVIVTGNLFPTGVSLGSKPTGTNVLGLIASDYVRVYHPCTSNTNRTGSFKNPWIYAAILATSHSWTVDNHSCGESEGELNVYGAIAQDYRGIVLVGTSGYVKNYEYDERLATDEPPYFLAPLKAGWKIVRETAPGSG
jgi:Tfp pilus assembly protein PilX